MIAPISSVTQIFPFSNSKERFSNNIVDSSVNEVLRRAKAMLYQGNINKSDPRAINLIILAETALKNGNNYAALNFSNWAIDILIPKSNIGLNTGKIKPPVEHKPEKTSQNKNEISRKSTQPKHMYQDVSHDAGVSFSYASSLNGPQSFISVPAHEAEHVGRRLSEAILNGDQIMVYVTYKIRYDPSTGQPYMAGGETRSITFSHRNKPDVFLGANVDLYA